MKILFITPHLSTGGLPQYLTKKIENLVEQHEIYVIEYNHVSSDFIVQRDRVKKLIGSKLLTFDVNTHAFLPNYINNNGFDVVHFEEFSESFVTSDILKNIYVSDRKYKIFETTHSASTQEKIFLPDAFIFVSSYHITAYEHYGVESYLVEYPLEYKEKSERGNALARLNLDPNKKHVLNVGLFTPGKNQGEIFEYAKHLPDHHFHFVGNQAVNFEFYWGELMQNKPDNCFVWGERNDVELFYDAADLFLFTSKLELNPLVIKEALSWNLPILMYDLPIYNDHFDSYNNIKYLTNSFETNLRLIQNNKPDISEELVVITAYPDTDEKNKPLIQLINKLKSFGYNIMISSHYDVLPHIQNMVEFNVIDLTDNLLYAKEYEEYNVRSFIYDRNSDRELERSMAFNHAYSVWTLWQNAVNSLHKNQFKKIHVIDYDCMIHDQNFIINHSLLLDSVDFVFYDTTDRYDRNRFTTNIFSFNITAGKQVFNQINSKKELFNNKYDLCILEQIIFALITDQNHSYIKLNANKLTRFGTDFDMVCVQNLNITDYQNGLFGYNIYKYDYKYDIIYLKNIESIVIDSKIFSDSNLGELFLLIPKQDTHIIEYGGYVKKYDMSEHNKYNTIKILNKNILDERFVRKYI